MTKLSNDYRSFEEEYHRSHSENVDDIVRACVEDIHPLYLESESILAGLELTIKEPHRGKNDRKCKAIFQLGQATAPEETQFLIGLATAVHHPASYLHPFFGSKEYPPQPRKVEPNGTLNYHDHTQTFYNPIKVELAALKAAGTLGDSNMVIPNNIIRYAQKRLPPAALRAKSVPDIGVEPTAVPVGLDSDDTASQPPLKSWWDREDVVPTRTVPTKAAAQTSNESLGEIGEDVSGEKSGGKVKDGMEGEVEDEAKATTSLTPA